MFFQLFSTGDACNFPASTVAPSGVENSNWTWPFHRHDLPSEAVTLNCHDSRYSRNRHINFSQFRSCDAHQSLHLIAPQRHAWRFIEWVEIKVVRSLKEQIWNQICSSCDYPATGSNMPGTGSRTGGHGMPPKMRTITFVDRLTFDFKGNIAQVSAFEIYQCAQGSQVTFITLKDLFFVKTRLILEGLF